VADDVEMEITLLTAVFLKCLASYFFLQFSVPASATLHMQQFFFLFNPVLWHVLLHPVYLPQTFIEQIK